MAYRRRGRFRRRRGRFNKRRFSRRRKKSVRAPVIGFRM